MNIWKKEDIEFLKNNYLVLGIANISKILTRSESSIKNKLQKLGLNFGSLKFDSKFRKNKKCGRGEVWTDDELDILRSEFEDICDLNILAKKLNKTVGSIRKKGKKLKLIRNGFKKSYNRYWTSDEEKYPRLRKVLYKKGTAKSLMDLSGRTHNRFKKIYEKYQNYVERHA